MMAGLLGLGGILALALSGWMLRSGWFCPPDEGRYTVVVLGAKVEGDAPSRMLRRRLETARDYLLAHPEAPVIVAGGQGSDERRSEASVMAAWLLEQGIESSRITGRTVPPTPRRISPTQKPCWRRNRCLPGC